MEYNENMEIIELVDENGETVQFRLLAGIEYEGKQYIALTEAEETDEESCEVFIMEVAVEADGSESYIQVEDEAVQEAVFNKFLVMMDEAEDDE